METRILTEKDLEKFKTSLQEEEKSLATIEKYLRDVRKFMGFAQNRPVTKELAIAFKNDLIESGYAVNSVNSMVASLNSFFGHQGWTSYRIKSIKQQRRTYCMEDKELTRAEYLRLLEAAESRPQLSLLLKTICGTGIRVSELQYFTVEAVKAGEIVIDCKNKIRRILIPGKLRKMLLGYANKSGIRGGKIFVTKTGKALDRSNIWSQMKSICEVAGVKSSKVFPHNLRKLFASTFYKAEKDIAKLADILGHSNVNTTRIYIMTSGSEHRRKIERLGLVI